MFSDVRAGRKRIIIGSTEKLGVRNQYPDQNGGGTIISTAPGNPLILNSGKGVLSARGMKMRKSIFTAM